MAAHAIPVNVLIVDDRPDGLLTLEAVLSSPEYRLIKASSGTEALAAILEHDFACIILDVQMPGMDGFETASLIKKRPRCKDIPIIFVTAINKDPAYIYRGYDAGAVDYLLKPFDPHVLRSKVAVFAELHRKSVQLKEKAELLRMSEERHRALIETASDLVCTISSEGAITSLNPAFENLTGWPTKDWIGLPFEKLVQHPDGSWLRNEFQRLPQVKRSVFEFRMKTARDELLMMEASCACLNDREKNSSCLLFARDITGRKEAERERQRRFELERSNHELQQFANVCSHDLQEPLRIVVNYAQLLSRRYSTTLDGQAKEYLGYIVDGSVRMSKLIKDLLNYSSIDSSGINLRSIRTQDVVDEALSNLQLSIHESGCQIELGELPPINGDHSQLVQLFQNLIGNAIKFRGSNAPVVGIEAKLSNREWIFSVSDNGVGFEMNYAPKIFEIFKRLHTADKYPGTGVGLAICKRIVERHQGRIWVTSEPKRGSVFMFTLPKLVDPPAEIPQTKEIQATLN